MSIYQGGTLKEPTVSVSLRIGISEKKVVTSFAEENGISFTEAIRMAIRDFYSDYFETEE